MLREFLVLLSVVASAFAQNDITTPDEIRTAYRLFTFTDCNSHETMATLDGLKRKTSLPLNTQNTPMIQSILGSSTESQYLSPTGILSLRSCNMESIATIVNV
jgi:hypothetical protein